MSTPPPAVITAYFDAANSHDADSAAQCFSDSAIVFDEGGEYQGRAAIATWVRETSNKYSTKTAVTGVSVEQGINVVRAQVSGNFPGSPISLRYLFTIEENKIARLEVKA